MFVVYWRKYNDALEGSEESRDLCAIFVMCGVKLDLNTRNGFWINVRRLSVPLDHLKCAILIRKDKNFSRKPVALISVSNSTDRIILRKKMKNCKKVISIPRRQTFEMES